MINIAICDDSHYDITALQTACEKCDLPCSINIEAFQSGKDFLESHKNKKYDIIFLDVDMPDINGLDVGKRIRQTDQNVIIIFCTNYPQYAINAYYCETFRYLVKPCSQELLQEALVRAIAKIRILHKYHVVKIKNKVQSLPIADISYIEYCRKHIVYHINGESIETTGRFQDIVDELHKYGFYQVHQGYTVNLSKVKDIQGYYVFLDTGEKVMISIRKKSETLLAYAKYTEEFQ